MSICCGNEGFNIYIAISKNTPKEKIEELKHYNLPIIFYDYPEAYYDEVGGYHDSAEGWNPNGVWCGECTRISCSNCSSRDVKEDK